jgi:predicted transcriptional regulator
MPRTTRDVRILEDRLLTLLRDLPGLTRAEMAPILSVTIQELDRPVTNLLHAGLVRRDGHKGASRYWLAVGALCSTG